MQVIQVIYHIAIIELVTLGIFSGIPSREDGVSSQELTLNSCNLPGNVDGYQNGTRDQGNVQL